MDSHRNDGWQPERLISFSARNPFLDFCFHSELTVATLQDKGALMAVACPRCNSLNPADNRHCSQCGAELHSHSNEVTLDEVIAVRSNPAAAELKADSVLSARYKILAEVGRGGMGVVYKAEDLKLKRNVALKFLSADMMREPDARKRFMLEAQAASDLDHPNICTIYEVNETASGQMYIAMAFYKGESLRDKIARGPLPPDEAVAITTQLARGLEKAHKNSIVHRDIKPANVLLTEDGLAKIVDFGLAKFSGSSRITRTGATVGTVAYMSPEQASGSDVDHRADLWSLGVVLFEMLTGQLPFKGEHHASLLHAIVYEPPRRLQSLRPDAPAQLERIVCRALEKNPESRYSSAEEFQKDLQTYLEEIRLAQTTPSDILALLNRARRPRVAIPSVLFLIVAGVLSAWLWSRQSKIRWAREVALPEIERLIAEGDAWRDSTQAYKLAEQAEAIIPNDSKLAELFSKCSLRMNIRTVPPGAGVFFKNYDAPQSDWRYLGETPLEKVRMPIGVFRWQLEKEGYETVQAAASSWDISLGESIAFTSYDLVRTLDKGGSIPPGMVRVAGSQTPQGKLDGFFIDALEVTNRQYKEFVNHAGYRVKKFWKHKFLRDGKELTWEQAMKEFVDQSGQPGPSTWQAGDFPEGQADFPVSGISWYEAAAYAEFAGKSLPTTEHWAAALGAYTPLIKWPQLGGFAVFAPFSNFKGKGPVAAGRLHGMTAFGALDMAGNVREWCWNETRKGRVLRGGAWEENIYMFGNLSQAPPMDRSPKNGFRGAIYPEPDKIPSGAFGMVVPPESMDFRKEKPVSDAIFEVYQEQFAYDRLSLNARVESRRENPAGWILEKVSFDAAYGGERIFAYLFLPKNSAPPYQTVVYFPGSASITEKSSRDIENYYEFPLFLSHIVKSGRAVLYPVYKGMFERGNDRLAALQFTGTNSRQFTELLIQQTKDLQRCLDYLETRPDIDRNNLAFYGMSGGGEFGPVLTSIEQRFKASVLIAGGINGIFRSEVSQIHYLPRVKTPTLMLNGRYDTIFPLETSSRPMFDLLGTPPEHKQMKLYETDHIPPRNEFIKESLAWFDRYLGPVK
jgi:serine/threonine protein kinase/dienelactone hydrolase